MHILQLVQLVGALVDLLEDLAHELRVRLEHRADLHVPLPQLLILLLSPLQVPRLQAADLIPQRQRLCFNLRFE